MVNTWINQGLKFQNQLPELLDMQISQLLPTRLVIQISQLPTRLANDQPKIWFVLSVGKYRNLSYSAVLTIGKLTHQLLNLQPLNLSV